MEGNELENIVLAKFYFLRVLVGPPTAIVEFRLRLHFSLISAPYITTVIKSSLCKIQIEAIKEKRLKFYIIK